MVVGGKGYVWRERKSDTRGVRRRGEERRER